MKKIFFIILSTFLFIVIFNVPTFASTDEKSENVDEQKIKECIEEFFYLYENVDYEEDTSVIVDEIADLTSEEIKYNYLLSKEDDTQSLEYESFINTIQYMLERREFIQINTDVDEQEYDKEINIDIKSVEFEDEDIKVSVEVYKTWYYIFSPDIESAAKDNYDLTLVNEDNVYVIKDIKGFAETIYDYNLMEYNDSISVEIKDKLLSELEESYIAEKTVIENETENADTSIEASSNNYNASDASAYALKYALSYNSNYADFSSSGGDCTNFISQCLYAGGINQHTGSTYSTSCWFYKSSSNRSATWTGANEFKNYVTGSNSKIEMPSSTWSGVSIGDIIQLTNSGSAYHSMIITGVAYGSSGRSDLLICCHTTDRRHVSLASYYSGITVELQKNIIM